MNLILNAAMAKFVAQREEARAVLHTYAANSVGIGEHSNLLDEVVTWTKCLAEAEEAIDTLNNQGFTRTTVQLARMRNKIDELSTALTKEGGLVTGDLKAIIDSNQGIYLNRAYRLFDDPSFTGWDKLPENVKLGATQYLRNAGVEEDQIEFVLKEILKRGSENDFRQGMKFLSEISLKSN